MSRNQRIGLVAAPPKPEVNRIQIRGGEVAGGRDDIEKPVEPGQLARYWFKTNLAGEFELESHTAEHAGLEPLVATLIVEPR
jgi:hypothetical protein